MTSQERFRLAQQLHKRAKDPTVSLKDRDVALRHACNLVRINMAVAVREISGTAVTPEAAMPPKAAVKSRN
jgi:hypothetical protein